LGLVALPQQKQTHQLNDHIVRITLAMTDYQSGGTMVMTAKEFRAAAYKQSYAGRKTNPAGPAGPAPTPETKTEAKAISVLVQASPSPSPVPIPITEVEAKTITVPASPSPLSTSTSTKIWGSASYKNQSVPNDPAKFMAEAQKQAEAYKHMKPTEVRKAIKADAERKKAEKQEKETARDVELKRKEKAKAVELEAQLRIQKIKSEINEIQQKESQEMNINRNKHPNKWAVGQSKRKLEMDLNDMKELEELANLDAHAGAGAGAGADAGLGVDLQLPQEVSKDGVKELDDAHADADGDDKSADLGADLQLPQEVSKDGIKELDATVAESLDDHGKDNSEHEPVSIKVPINPAKEPHHNLTATRSGNICRTRGAPTRRSVSRTPSNLVPEMRRKASRSDLMFDEDDIDIIPSAKDLIKKLKRQESKESTDSNSNSAPDDEKVSPSAPNERIATDPASPVTTKPPSAEKSQTRKDLDEQREKLEKAKASFQKGHDLCWKFQDSPGALGEYRNALIVRESLLGKYHEDTGRSYYWIGRSLVKLQEFDEGLMAFTRAQRIFERVLTKNHKFVRWVDKAIDNVFKEMDMEDAEEARDEYKKAMEASIASEREGDACRKKGQHAQAIAKYRDAIDNIDQYHPDAADLFCKIAIILRGQGEFDRALEEYRYASEIYELSLGADHPETVKTLNNLIEKKRLNQISMALMEKLESRES
jgi:tetratricopeptide (TPR) repeat protein